MAEYLVENYKAWCLEWCEENDVEINAGAFIEYFKDDYDPDGWLDLPDDIKTLHMQEIEVTVNTHFTEADAKAFIERKQHDYPKLYTYATSLCFCWNMIELRQWIMSLTKENN